MEYATNTLDKVIKVGDVYYLCLQGVWFMSSSPNGPWTTATSVPQEIYSIPPSSPVYNVTYVTQSTVPDGTIQSSYTAGYFGTFIAGAALGAILANGTGYYYPPYYGYPVGGYPIYHPYACTYGAGAYYNPYMGAYGVARGVYGPYQRCRLPCGIQSVHRNLCPRRYRLRTLRQPECGPSLQSVYRELRRDQTRFEPVWFVGAIRRLQWQ